MVNIHWVVMEEVLMCVDIMLILNQFNMKNYPIRHKTYNQRKKWRNYFMRNLKISKERWNKNDESISNFLLLLIITKLCTYTHLRNCGCFCLYTTSLNWCNFFTYTFEFAFEFVMFIVIEDVMNSHLLFNPSTMI